MSLILKNGSIGSESESGGLLYGFASCIARARVGAFSVRRVAQPFWTEGLDRKKTSEWSDNALCIYMQRFDVVVVHDGNLGPIADGGEDIARKIFKIAKLQWISELNDRRIDSCNDKFKLEVDVQHSIVVSADNSSSPRGSGPSAKRRFMNNRLERHRFRTLSVVEPKEDH